jgi:iron complex outermembrane recepter protein
MSIFFTRFKHSCALGVSLFSLHAYAQTAPVPAAPAPEAAPDTRDIIVTATRRDTLLSKVPISVTAFSQARAEQLGIKNFADAVKFTPGVNLEVDGTHEIAIRGIASNAGASTTGIYIDDTPIQMRQLGLNPNNALPIVFDLDRLEVLRGPQGTLFGSGSEGGTVRFITATPSLKKTSLAARLETSAIEKGGMGFEGGATLGAPLVQDRLGMRVSVFCRKDGGYIDHLDPYSGTITPNNNWVKSAAVHAALLWKPGANISLAPSILYQDRNTNSNDVAGYFVGLSNPANNQFLDATPSTMQDHDHYYLATLKAEYSNDHVKLISNTSYFDRTENVGGYDGTLYNLSYFQHSLDPSNAAPYGLDPSGADCTATCNFGAFPLLTAKGISPALVKGFGAYTANNIITNTQQNFTQEVRLQSNGEGKLSWTLGVFYSHINQLSDERIIDPQLGAITQYLFGEDLPTAWGVSGLLPGGVSYENHGSSTETQLAGFLDATYEIAKGLKANVGARYAKSSFSFNNYTWGPEAFTNTQVFKSGSFSETPFTPKFNLSWQIDPKTLVYATASKGYRAGGANAPLLTACGVNAPSAFNSDSLWNYEMGAKSKLAGGKLRLAGSAYYINWSNIQQSIYLAQTCGQQFVANLGSLTSKGFDMQVEATPLKHLSLDVSLAYNDAQFTKNSVINAVSNGTTIPIVAALQGDAIEGPPWTLSLGLQYDFNLHGRKAFIRFDDQYRSHNPNPLPSTDAALYQGQHTISYDAALINDPATNQASARMGWSLSKQIEGALFVNNLFNAHPLLNLAHQDAYTATFVRNSFTPRTFGVSFNIKM